MDGASGSDTLARALAELETRSPAWRRGIGTLRRLTGTCLHPEHELVLLEARTAPALWRELAALPLAQQIAAVESEERFQTWGLCRLLQSLSGELAVTDPEGAARLANLAVRIPRHLAETRYDPEFVRDLLGLGCCYLGNAWRELGELHSAGGAFDLAETLRGSATGYRSFEAEALALAALLRRDQRRLDEAVALLDRIEEIYGAAATAGTAGAEPDLYDPDRQAEARVHRGWCLYHLGQVEAAAAGLAAAADALAERRQERLLLAARCGLLWCSLTLGQASAEQRLAAALELAERAGGEADRLRLGRAQARLDVRLGERGPAEQSLRTTARRCSEIGLGIEAALTYFDLAALYLAAGAGDALEQLGSEVLPVFSALAAESPPVFSLPDVQRAQMAALLLFQQACQAGRLTPSLLRQLAVLIEEQRRPSLAWWSGATTLPFGDGGGDATPGAGF